MSRLFCEKTEIIFKAVGSEKAKTIMTE